MQFNFTYSGLLAQNKDLAAAFLGNVEAAWSNVHSAGALALYVICCGLRRGQRWAWFLLLYLLVWSGISDTIAAVHLHKLTGKIVPMPMIAKAFLLVGLWLSRDILRNRQISER